MAGNRYFLSFVDEHSRMMWVFFIKAKNDVLEIFKKFKASAEKESGKVLKILKTDGGREYNSLAFGEFCQSEGIKHEVIHAPT